MCDLHRKRARKAQDRRSRDYDNCEARDHIFRMNHTDCADDKIDLRGLYVKEAMDILQKRLDMEIKKGSSDIQV